MWAVYAWRGAYDTGLEVEIKHFESENDAAKWQRNAKKPNKARVITGSQDECVLRKLLWNREENE